jgi:hypothetical protein
VETNAVTELDALALLPPQSGIPIYFLDGLSVTRRRDLFHLRLPFINADSPQSLARWVQQHFLRSFFSIDVYSSRASSFSPDLSLQDFAHYTRATIVDGGDQDSAGTIPY